MLDAKTVVPLYIQLMEEIEENIRRGLFPPGEKLPAEALMAKQYGVSVVTVRNAVSSLAEKGLIERKQGKGTYVTNSKFTRDIQNIQSFSQRCLHMGIQPGGRMLSNRLVPAGEKMCEQLEVESGSFLVYLSRLRTADGEPVAIENNYFPMKYAFLLDKTLDDDSLLELIKSETGDYVAVSKKRIELCRATDSEADLLGVAQGDPLLYIKSIAYTKDQVPMYVGTQIFNGERCSFYVSS